MYFSHICHFRPMTQPNPLITQIFDPFPTQPNPTRGSTQPMDNSGPKAMTGEVIPSAKNSGKPLGGRGSAPNPAGEFTAFPQNF